MRISAIIPSLWDVDKDYVKLCVESLRESTKNSPHHWDIILVTNGSKDDVLVKKEDVKGITVHLNTKDQGQCVATNMGASVADGDYFFVSNADMYYAPGWDENLRFDHPVFSPNLVEPTNNVGSAQPFLKLNAGFTLDEFNRKMIDNFIGSVNKLGRRHSIKHGLLAMRSTTNDSIDKNIVWKDGVREEPGFNLPFFIRNDVWRTLGGYDTNYDPWGSNSDTDLQTRINLAGITPMRLRDVLVYHFSNKSGTFDFSQPQRQEFYNHNIEYFKNKFGFDRDELGSDVWMNKDMLPKDKSRIKFKADWIGKYAN